MLYRSFSIITPNKTSSRMHPANHNHAALQLCNKSRKENLSTVNYYSELLGFRTLSFVRYSQN
jgi:hypothetical protein